MVADAILEPGTARIPPPEETGPRRLLDETRGNVDSALLRAAEQLQEGDQQLGRGLSLAQTLLQRHLAPSGSGQMGPGAVRAHTGAGDASLEGLVLLAQGPGGPRNVGVAIVADPLVLLVVGGDRSAVHWSLMPGGETITQRADALRLLRVLSAPGSLVFETDSLGELPSLSFDGAEWTDEQEWQLFEALATIEEWSGAELPMPGSLTSEEVSSIAQRAAWIRQGRVVTRVGDQVRFRPTDDLLERPDELRLREPFELRVAGRTVGLGFGVATIRLSAVGRGSEEAGWWSARPEHTELIFRLEAPASRRLPPKRTPLEAVPSRLTQMPAIDEHWFPVARPATRHLPSRTAAAGAGQPVADVLDDLRDDRDL